MNGGLIDQETRAGNTSSPPAPKTHAIARTPLYLANHHVVNVGRRHAHTLHLLRYPHQHRGEEVIGPRVLHRRAKHDNNKT